MALLSSAWGTRPVGSYLGELADSSKVSLQDLSQLCEESYAIYTRRGEIPGDGGQQRVLKASKNRFKSFVSAYLCVLPALALSQASCIFHSLFWTPGKALFLAADDKSF